jgi:hypothetical protein
LEKDPEKRFQSVTALAAVLAGGETPTRIEAPPILPQHLVAPRILDLVLLAVSLLGLFAYLLSAARVAPESQIRVQWTREQFIERARAELSSRGWPPPPQSWLHVTEDAAAERARVPDVPLCRRFRH